MDLRWRLAVVTGAGAGLGREVALRLARVGASVLVADRDVEAADETAALVRAHRVPAWPCPVDLTDDADLLLLAERARDLGGADLLVNNAGAWTPGEQQYPAAPVEAWSRTLDLDLRAPMRLTQLFLDGLGRRAGSGEPGAVVNVSSSAALGREPYGSPEYAAAKAALVRLTTALGGADVAALARVTCVVPGWIGLERAERQWAALDERTRAASPPLVPPGDVARVVLELLSRGRAGTVVEMLGGRTARWVVPEGP